MRMPPFKTRAEVGGVEMIYARMSLRLEPGRAPETRSRSFSSLEPCNGERPGSRVVRAPRPEGTWSERPSSGLSSNSPRTTNTPPFVMGGTGLEPVTQLVHLEQPFVPVRSRALKPHR
jgi:hypothetical protein